jgi:diacylglycerol kinase family enzyme
MVALQSSFSPALRSVLRQPRPRRVAVVLNANARRVDQETIRWIQAVVPRQDLFLSRSLAQGPALAEEILIKGYDAILWGGGDGTFAAGVQNAVAAATRHNLPVPEMGVLRLGTGNAIADAIGANPATAQGLADDLRRARGATSRRNLQMLSVEGRPGLFCGFGLDAQILDDFGATVRLLERLNLADKVRSAGVRYFMSVAGKSIPRFALAQRSEIVAINRGAPAIKVDVEGNQIGAPIPSGRVLWRGTASLASAGTIPFYGLGLRVFPHADRVAGRFQLRMSDARTAEIVAHLPAIWRGRYQGERIHDFLVDEVELVVAKPAPFQANGDLLGSRERVTLSLWPESVPVV